MLPLWRDQLRIGIAPDRLILVRIGKGLRPKITEKQVVKCAPQSDRHWESPLDLLAKCLTEPKWQNATASVIVSNHFVRYQIVPWSPDITGELEQTAFVKHCFTKVYGETTNNWALSYCESPAGSPGIASAIDQSLLDGLKKSALQGKLRLHSVQPFLMPAFNQNRQLFKEDSAWLVILEKEKFCISLFHEQKWQSINTKLIEKDDWATELPFLLDRLWRLTNLDNPPSKVFLVAPGQQLTLPRKDKWVMQQLLPKAQFGLTSKDITRFALVMGN